MRTRLAARRLRQSALVLLVTLAALAAAVAPARAAGIVQVGMYDNFFTPAVITIPAGTTVVWVHFGNDRHTTTADVGPFWDSGTIFPRGTYAVFFPAPGSYPYHCSFHPGMRGTVLVVPAVPVSLLPYTPFAPAPAPAAPPISPAFFVWPYPVVFAPVFFFPPVFPGP
ncbi:MAG: cupredoxin domain-containing protein [Chloroflexi bacterium]|nr:cupredoxin domain-containing protein [Chloroflexota bacterium]